jgi:L-arabinose isomerase
VARALWQPRPDLKTAAAAWILAGGAHHTGFSFDVTAEQMQDFAEIADLEMLLIDEETRLSDFKKELRWNEIFYTLARGI